MTWEPIEDFDALTGKRRPLAAFYFKASAGPRPHVPGLSPTIQLTRHYGIRVCTHFCRIPEPPRELP